MFPVLDRSIEDKPPHERYQVKTSRGSSHSWALERLRGHVAGRRILDIGAGSGGIGAAIRQESPQELLAVEIDERSHAHLATIYHHVYTDISSLQGSQFDWIILLDVLEHMPTPSAFVNSLRPLLASGGKFLVSVPNVAHWSVRFPLFFLGSFEYGSLGIMDCTHLHFFSRKGFHRLFTSLDGCSIVETSATIEPFELALPEWASRNSLYEGLIPLRHWLARTFPGLMAYQHLAIMQCQDK